MHGAYTRQELRSRQEAGATKTHGGGNDGEADGGDGDYDCDYDGGDDDAGDEDGRYRRDG